MWWRRCIFLGELSRKFGSMTQNEPVRFTVSLTASPFPPAPPHRAWSGRPSRGLDAAGSRPEPGPNSAASPGETGRPLRYETRPPAGFVRGIIYALVNNYINVKITERVAAFADWSSLCFRYLAIMFFATLLTLCWTAIKRQ